MDLRLYLFILGGLIYKGSDLSIVIDLCTQASTHIHAHTYIQIYFNTLFQQIYFNTFISTQFPLISIGDVYKLKLGHRNIDRLYDYIHIWFEQNYLHNYYFK